MSLHVFLILNQDINITSFDISFFHCTGFIMTSFGKIGGRSFCEGIYTRKHRNDIFQKFGHFSHLYVDVLCRYNVIEKLAEHLDVSTRMIESMSLKEKEQYERKRSKFINQHDFTVSLIN